ncbi:MAG: type I methionyl aminopeptidase [Synergistaceae bacterium]|jgi:methionyl aminopeptidase|nr:type I methionyl aminopeptidase [Synergistaceae bacterium]
MITLKKPAEAEKMRKAGQIVASVHKAVRDAIKPGIDTLTLDQIAERVIGLASARASFKGYRVPGVRVPFPSSICVSVNDEVVHGIPNRSRFLDEGDIVSIDVGAEIEGYHGDAACTYPVGRISPEREELLYVTRRALDIGIGQVKPGHTIGDIGHAVEQWVLGKGYGLVREYSGHGIGRKMHEPPQVPNYGKPGSGLTIRPGLTFCIEPMVMSGGEPVRNVDGGWTVVTCDGSDAAHFEHSILVTEDGAEILTPWE